MRLQRLEIAGFKSFSDRSELAFDEGVTAIVGPNGCGKSNVADAITWVLGEQSAKSLRGDKMEDVIFNGSDARKPTGAAEVRLRLAGVTTLPSAMGGEALELPMNGNGGASGTNGHGANGHGAISAREVEVIRRLYRSGESEYLIDGQLCRLKDVHELLMDTGLGAKAYAIIEQGKIGLILSSRPADRRQLIEEAAGITKYKSRRRAAELKLEAAQQNLTRIDDIVFEVEKQRGTLKRQAAKARRYQKLRDEMRRWEKVLFAGRYRELGAAIEAARTKLTDARARETAAAGRVAELEATLSRLRIEVAEIDARATRVRDAAHERELEAQRRHQQVELNKQQVASLESRTLEMDAEINMLEARREPGRVALEERRAAATAAEAERARAADTLASEQEAWQSAGRELEGLEHDLEAARSAVYHAVTGVTTLRHALEHAASARERVSETLARLDVEDGDLSVEREALAASRVAAEDARAHALDSLEGTRVRRAAEEAALLAARQQHESLARDLRAREQDLAGLAARMRSLEELDASRAGFGDAARVVLAQANGAVSQLGAVADYLDVDRSYERAVEAVLGELLQHVVVPTHAHASAGLDLVRQHDAGRCGFLVLEGADPGSASPSWAGEGVRPLSSVARAAGEHGETVARALFSNAWIAESYDDALAAARRTGGVVATTRGDVVRGAHLVTGGTTSESRGILATKGEIRELRERLASERGEAALVAERVAGLESAIATAQRAIESATHDVHHYEKALVGHDAQLARAAEDATRLARKGELLALDRRRAEQEGSALDQRQAEARESIAALEVQQREADERFNAAQGRLASARAANEDLSHRVAEAKAVHAGLTERASGLAAEVARLEDAARELDERVAHLHRERAQKDDQRVSLVAAIEEGLRLLDEDVRALDALKAEVHEAEAAASAGHSAADAQESEIRVARGALDAIRAEAGDLEIGRATAESDLAHLASQCAEIVQASLDDVLAQVEQMEREGAAVPDARTIAAEDAEEPTDEAGEPIVVAAETESSAAADIEGAGDAGGGPAPAEPPASLTAEEAIAALKAKIDRLGPVNMMAIEQYEELEQRHTFLTTQRKDLVDSIAQTGEAIRRIDETSKARFREAFTAINQNFQRTFGTLFGGGRAGITLLDESDPLESGIDIVASPPGKRLQSVMLLSGGEKALTAIALMFAIFQYKPSPFCLLDEIDAPLDDANIGRFVEMLKGMLHHTQFILITHNRKTMEIADRLYGVTMEEPGVSKLISVRLN
jgi:chromosome segregation protein